MSAHIIHLETATEVCSIGISKDDEILAIEESQQGYIHSAKITLMIKAAMDKAGITFSQLDAVSLSQGPGSYTSLRVGTSAAKAICYSQGIPLIAIDTLASLALAAAEKEKGSSPGYYIPMIDARRMEVYTAVFDFDNNRVEDTHAKIMDDTVFRNLLTADNRILFCGNGLEKCKPLLDHPQMKFSETFCTAKNLIKPALECYQRKAFVDTAYFSPYYYKSPNVTISKKNIL